MLTEFVVYGVLEIFRIITKFKFRLIIDKIDLNFYIEDFLEEETCLFFSMNMNDFNVYFFCVYFN